MSESHETAHEMNAHQAAIHALKSVPNPRFSHDDKKFSFKGRTDKGPDGKEIKVPARNPVELVIPHYTWHGVVETLNDPAIGEDVQTKVQTFIVDLINNAVDQQVRAQLTPDDDDAKAVETQDMLDLAKLRLEFIVNQPKAQRGGGIPAETWELFAEDYVRVMVAFPDIASKTQAEAGAKILASKLNSVKTNKPLVKKLMQRLHFYFEQTDRKEDVADCVDYLNTKADNILKSDEQALLESV